MNGKSFIVVCVCIIHNSPLVYVILPILRKQQCNIQFIRLEKFITHCLLDYGTKIN